MADDLFDKVLRAASIIALLGAGTLCVWNLIQDDVPKPRFQWHILYVYLPVLCLLGVSSEVGFSRNKYMDFYFRFLNRRAGRGSLYVFIGALLLDFDDTSEWKNWVFGVVLCVAGLINFVAACQGDGGVQAVE